jgi:hypothetical protein
VEVPADSAGFHLRESARTFQVFVRAPLRVAHALDMAFGRAQENHFDRARASRWRRGALSGLRHTRCNLSWRGRRAAAHAFEKDEEGKIMKKTVLWAILGLTMLVGCAADPAREDVAPAAGDAPASTEAASQEKPLVTLSPEAAATLGIKPQGFLCGPHCCIACGPGGCGGGCI